jgi:hypothetical protein
MAELLGGSAAKLNRADLSNVKNLIFSPDETLGTNPLRDLLAVTASWTWLQRQSTC